MVANTAENLYYILSVLGTCQTEQCQRSAAMISGNMNTNFDPCKNFYNYACGNFENQHPRPTHKKVIDYFRLREEEIRTKVLKPYDLEVIMHHLEMVGLPSTPPFHAQIPASFDESTVLAKIHRYSPMTSFLFNVAVTMDPRNKSTNHIFFGHTPPASKAPISISDKASSEFEATAEEILLALMKILKSTVNFMYAKLRVNLTPSQKLLINTRAFKVAEFLLELDKAVNIDRFMPFADLVYVSSRRLQTSTNIILRNGKIQINWNKYFEVLFERIAKRNQQFSWTKIMLQSSKQMEYVLKVLQKTDREIFVCALWFAVLQSIIDFAPEYLQDINDEYQITVSKTEIQPRATRKKEVCSQDLLSRADYVVRYVLAVYEDGLEKRDAVKPLVEAIRQGLHGIILESHWLDQETKTEAVEKLHRITSFVSVLNSELNFRAIEYSYKDMNMESNYYLTYLKSIQFSRGCNLNLIQEQNTFASKNTSSLNPSSVQTVYDSNREHLSIAMGFIAFPFYGLGLNALNYAAMGSQIGHELDHAFHKEGKKYDGYGNNILWRSDQSTKEYQKQEKCFQQSYGSFFYGGIKKFVNGYSTLFENIADTIGFAAALKAYRYNIAYYGPEQLLIHHETLTHEQLFTLAFANIWCQNASPQYTRETIENDIHSPASSRVNGVFRNSRDFAQIWHCPEGTPMNPKFKCDIFS